MDALSSFVHLTDRLPSWITKLDQLVALVTTKREEFAAEYKKALKHVRPRKRRSQSVVSLRTGDNQSSIISSGTEANDQSVPRPIQVSPFEPGNIYLFANARRDKRRKASSRRSGVSASQPSRNQAQAIIYYDSPIQNGFGELVKEIATARNNLRKGQHARALECGFQLPPLRSWGAGRTRRGPASPRPIKSHPTGDTVEKADILPADGPQDREKAITEATSELEAAQGLCETAAHQFLRNGNCISETSQIRVHLDNVVGIAELEVEALKREQTVSTGDARDLGAAGSEEDPGGAKIAAGKLSVDLATVVSTAAAEIEVDSEDADDEDGMVMDMSRFRSARVHGLRV